MSNPQVVIADDHPLFRTALKQAVVECIADVEILEAENLAELLKITSPLPSI